jgi:hypothetical protein
MSRYKEYSRRNKGKVCLVSGCRNKARARGYCLPHYNEFVFHKEKDFRSRLQNLIIIENEGLGL